MLGHTLHRALVRAPVVPMAAMACAAFAAAAAASSVISAAYLAPGTNGPPAPALQTAAPEGRHGHLDLLDPVAAARSDDGAATPAAGAAAQPPWAGKIKKLDDHTFEVDRSLVRELVGGTAKPGGTRVAPRVEAGKMTGMRLYAVKPDSLAGALGLESADVVSGINNVPITSAQTLLDVYAKLDSLNVVEIAGERAGRPMTWTLRLE